MIKNYNDQNYDIGHIYLSLVSTMIDKWKLYLC